MAHTHVRDRIGQVDIDRHTAPGLQLGNYAQRSNLATSTSYVTGSHNVKVGFQDAFGPSRLET